MAIESLRRLPDCMKERLENFLTAAGALFAAVLLVYILTAPPVMMSIARQRGSLSFPAIYRPIVSIIESDYNGPLLWYFNDVWHSGIILLGEESTPPRVIAAYALVGVAIVAAVSFPFVRR